MCLINAAPVDKARVIIIQSLEARAVTLYVFRISEHTRSTHVKFVLAPLLFPLCHVIKSSGKFFASNPLNDLFAAVTDNFNRSDSRVHCLLSFPTGTCEERFWGRSSPTAVDDDCRFLLLGRRRGRHTRAPEKVCNEYAGTLKSAMTTTGAKDSR